MGIDNKPIEYTLATVGACLWMLVIIPQLIKSYREKSTQGLSPHLMSLWASSSLFYGTYTVASEMNIALQIQPHVFGTLCMCSWTQCMYYDHGVSGKRALLYFGSIMAVAALLESSGIFALLYAQEHGTAVPMDFVGYFSTGLTAVGFIPQYYEIFKLREVRGISLIFLSADILGGCLAASALFFRPELDYVGLSTYLIVALADLVIIILSFILNPAAKRGRLAQPQPDDIDTAKTRPASRLSGISHYGGEAAATAAANHHGRDRPLSRVSAYRWDPHADDPVSAIEKGMELSPVSEHPQRPMIVTSGVVSGHVPNNNNNGFDVQIRSAHGLDTPVSALMLQTPASPPSARVVGWSDRRWDKADHKSPGGY